MCAEFAAFKEGKIEEGCHVLLKIRPRLLLFINLQPLKKLSTTNYAPIALDRELGSLTDILRPS